jgi:hypothetical protein
LLNNQFRLFVLALAELMMSDPSLRIDEIQSRQIFVFEIAPERMVVIERESTRVIKTEAWEMNNWTMVSIDTFVSTRRAATTDESTTENLKRSVHSRIAFYSPLIGLDKRYRPLAT